MQYIYFMRHGETAYNLAGRVQGGTDIPLNETGIREAYLARDYFEKNHVYFDRVVSSPLRRARRTAMIVSGRPQTEIAEDPRIVELNFGDAEGKFVRDLPEGVLNLFFHPERYEVPANGESVPQLRQRCSAFLADMAQIFDREPETENILAVSHGAALRGMISCIGNSAPEDFWVDNLENCCSVRTSYADGQFHIEEYLHPLSGTEFMVPPWRRIRGGGEPVLDAAGGIDGR